MSTPTPRAAAVAAEQIARQKVDDVVLDRIDTQVGSGGYRIDLAVVYPRDPTRYCLAIECDGAAYHSDRSARIRDVWRQGILEQRGWRFHRIWSRSWWDNQSREVERLADAVRAALEG